MSAPNLESASGLRPASAYLCIALVLVVVCGRSWVLSMVSEHSQPTRAGREEFLPTPDFDIADREGRPLALSVQRMDLALSPRSMWQAHTPEIIAEAIVPHLDGARDVSQLLRDFFPSAQNGMIRVRAKGWTLNYDRAKALRAWVNSNGMQSEFWLERLPERSRWQICWRPAELLSKVVRERVAWQRIRPLEWTRWLADGVSAALFAPLEGKSPTLTFEQKEARRALVWKALLPCADTVAITHLPPAAVFELSAVLDSQGVASHQMSIRFEHERVYPERAGALERTGFDVLGKWRFIDRPRALVLAEAEGDGAFSERRVRELLDARHPVSGLEGLAADLLSKPAFDFIRKRPASYRFRRVVAIHQPSRRYYRDSSPEDATPRVKTTLDSNLQRFLLGQLDHTAKQNRAAVAMGIVVEVGTGDVLAVGGVSTEEVSEFLPTWHTFSPGSTFKVVAMATALEAGVVSFAEPFDTFDGRYRVPGSRTRVIHEAEGAPRGRIPAWMGLSRSVNAVLVQIGMRVPDDFFYGKLKQLGYGGVSQVSVGRQSKGRVPKLPWSPAFTHASVSFGHELSVSLWQHASALATIMRGGIRRPLRMLRSVDWDGQEVSLDLEDGARVFRTDTCATVRTMMAEGARTGTGRHITAAERKLGTPIELLSKTGTTEKEAGVVCLHKELKRNAFNAHLEGGRKHPDFITFASIKAQPNPHEGSCYTSSICLVGRVAGEQRELMVIVVVEEPSMRLRFGSDVAGPAAIAILKESLGLTTSGTCVVERVAQTPDYGYTEFSLAEAEDEPWRLRPDDQYELEGLR